MQLYNLLTKRNIIIAGVALLVVACVASLLLWLRNPYGEEMQISNLDSYTQGQPIDRQTMQHIQHSLYTIIKDNYPGPIASNSLSDILIRDGSYSQHYDKEKGLRLIRFIVDIKSIRQSYQIEYAHSQNGEVDNSGIYQYSNMASCVPQDQMIYGYFYCKDLFTQMNDSNTPALSIDWSATDKYDNSLFIQLEDSERDFIMQMTFDDYRKHHKLTSMSTPSQINDVVRNTENNQNSLAFTVVIEEKATYQVLMNYSGRVITIKNEHGALVATNASAA